MSAQQRLKDYEAARAATDRAWDALQERTDEEEKIHRLLKQAMEAERQYRLKGAAGEYRLTEQSGLILLDKGVSVPLWRDWRCEGTR